MENIIAQVMAFLPSVVFCIIVWFLVLLSRNILDHFCPNVRKTRFWKKVVLQSFPVVMGGLIAIIVPDYPFPEHFADGSPHAFFGMFLGYLSGHVYSAVKYYVKDWVEKLAAKFKSTKE